jgi:hypothetical protein
LTLFFVIFFQRGLDLEVAIFFPFGHWNKLGGVGSRAENRDGIVLGSLSNPITSCSRYGLVSGPSRTQYLHAREVDSCWGPSRTQYLPTGEVDLEVLDDDSVDLEVLEETVALAPSLETRCVYLAIE